MSLAEFSDCELRVSEVRQLVGELSGEFGEGGVTVWEFRDSLTAESSGLYLHSDEACFLIDRGLLNWISGAILSASTTVV